MQHLGDFAAGSAVRGAFNTRKADGTPITLAGTPVLSVYKDGNTTETTIGVTLTVDFDSRTGHHLFAIDTSDAFYSSGSDFRVVITTGTVDSISVVGAQVGSFSILNRSALRPTVAGRTLDVSTGGEAGIDFANIGSPSTTVNLSGTTIKAVTDRVSANTDQWAGVAVTGMPMPTYTQPSGFLAATFPLTVASTTNITTVGSVSGSVGSVSSPVTAGTVSDKTGYSLVATTGLGNQTANITGNLSGSVGSVTGAVGSVTGAVTVGTVSANVINAASIATDAVTKIQTGLATSTSASTIQAVTTKLDTTMELSGANYRFTSAALEQAPAGGGGGGGGTGDASQATLLLVKAKTDLITANTVYTTVDRVYGSTITTYFNESTSINVPLQEDTTSKTLRFIVENSDALDVLVIENASITRTASQFTVTITTAVTAMLGQYKWSLRDITGGINRVVQLGVLQVVGAANKDA